MNSADHKKPRERVSRRTPFAAAIVALAFAAGGARAHGAPAGAPSTESGAAAQSSTSAEDRTGGARPFEYKKGLVFRSEDGSAQIKLSGYLQGDGRFYQGDDQGLAVDTFLIRRARAIVDASFLQRFDLRIVPDFGQGKTVLFDGYLNVRFNPPAQIRFGKFKPPIGLERLQSATSTSFAERALPTNLVPNRDVGLQLHGDILDQTLVYAVGLWNGVPDGVNGGDADTNDGKDSVARLFYKPWNRTKAAALRNLGIGLAVSRGTEIGTAAAPTLPSYLTAGQVTFFKYRSTGVLATTAVAAGRLQRLAPQLYYYVGPFGFLGEHVRSKQSVALGANTAELENKAWQATATFVLTGEKASYDGVTPKKPLTARGTGLGALELALRYGDLRIDDRAFPIFADSTVSARRARAWGAGFNWYLNANAKLVVDYELTRFTEGGPLGADREDEKAFFFRLQLAS